MQREFHLQGSLRELQATLTERELIARYFWLRAINEGGFEKVKASIEYRKMQESLSQEEIISQTKASIAAYMGIPFTPKK